MAKILIRTLSHCVGRETEDGPEVTFARGRVVLVEEDLARSCIRLGGAEPATEADLEAQALRDAEIERIEEMKRAALGQQ